MIRRMPVVFGVVGLIAAVVPAAVAEPDGASAELTTPGTSRTLTLPASAGNPHVIELGTAVDPGSGRAVEGYAIVHYRPGFDHKPNHRGRGPGGGGGGGGGTSSCYAFLSKGAQWNSAEPYVVNPANAAGLDVSAGIADAVAKWENAANGHDIFGGGTLGANLVADTSSPDGDNEIYFGEVSNAGAIAVTIVWGIFSGPPSGRALVEWDQVYDQVDFEWSDSGAAGKMDLSNIAVHEVGHAAGMGHPDDSCTEETMYRFASAGETKKQDLNAGDIAGILQLYS